VLGAALLEIFDIEMPSSCALFFIVKPSESGIEAGHKASNLSYRRQPSLRLASLSPLGCQRSLCRLLLHGNKIIKLRRETHMVSPATRAAMLGSISYRRTVLNMAEVPVVGVRFAPLYEVVGLYTAITAAEINGIKARQAFGQSNLG